MLRPDFGATSADYATHREGFPESFFERLLAFGVGPAGQRIVDLGTGTGTLARGFARRGCEVVGVDLAAPQLEQAKRLDVAAGVRVSYRCARAERTGLESAWADVVTAGQCWHWFDRGEAAAEAARLLRPRGRIVIGHFCWIPLAGNVAAATEALILAHNPAWHLAGGTGVHPEWLRDLGEAGYHDAETFSYDVEVSYSHERWRGRIRASAGVGATLPPEKVATFDKEMDRMLSERFPRQPLQVPHRVFAVLAVRP